MILQLSRYALIGCLTLASVFVLAKGKANNDSLVQNDMNEAIRVYWTAAGCAKVVDGKAFVCESRVIEPGQLGRYAYGRFTSVNKVAVSGPKACDSKNAVDALGVVTVNPDCTLGDEPTLFTNKRSETITVYWTAVGCAKIKDGVTFVCRTTSLNTGESDRYAFPKLTTDRGLGWTSVKCPITPNNRFGNYSMAPRNVTDDKSNCGSSREYN